LLTLTTSAAACKFKKQISQFCSHWLLGHWEICSHWLLVQQPVMTDKHIITGNRGSCCCRPKRSWWT
jgi:hypothetical protein